MYRRQQHLSSAARRKGVILLVVITLLTLFAVVGLTFVLYAESEATSARTFREAQNLEDIQEVLKNQPPLHVQHDQTARNQC